MALKIKPDEIVTFEDGYKYYWPLGFLYGAFSASHLRDIADQLDVLNADWDQQVIAELGQKDKRWSNNKKKREDNEC